MKSSPRVAIVHDWLTTYAGAERVLKELLTIYPEADLFSVIDFLGEEFRKKLLGKKAKTTFIQKLPFSRKKYFLYLPLMPYAIERLDLTSYDLIISSSHSVAHGVIPSPDALHICYCHTPMRYAWDLTEHYPQNSLTRFLLHKLRLWDTASSSRVDAFIANSKFVKRRIAKAYRRESTVIYNPIDLSFFTPHFQKEDFYFTASRLVPYKKMDLIVDAFSHMPEKKLIVMGEGRMRKKMMRKASKNIEFLGYQSDEVLHHYLQRAKAFIFAGIEDFGRIAVEAQACGTPVIAFRKGGMAEIVSGLDEECPTGHFFEEQTRESIVQAVFEFEKNQEKILGLACRKNAEKFSSAKFRLEFTRFVEREIKKFKQENYESHHPRRRERDTSVALIPHLLSQTISQNRES